MAVRLSVVVPVYGTEKYLRKCLESLAQQTLRDAEFILVDDCTPDQAGAIMAEYEARDSRFRVLRHERNRGLFAARLTGAESARGEYISFLDSDDYVSVDFYRAAADYADEGGFDIVLGDTVWVQEDGTAVVRPVHEACLPEEPLYGDEVRQAFYCQEMQCYSWHTIWNRIIRRELFDRCIPYFRKLPEPVIMTEDIAFSSVLMYEARSLGRIRGDGVFYCMHAASSTGAAFADQKRFFRNYGDIVKVFDFVSSFLQDKRDDACLAHLAAARRWYARMWTDARHKCAPSGEAKANAAALTARLAPGFDADAPMDNSEIWWFDQQTAPWNSGLEKIKRAIAGVDGKAPDVVSFDVFDTLILRPFRQPTDLFCLLEDQWQQANRRCMLSFAQARGEAEASARAWASGKRQEVTLDDIYQALQLTTGASATCAEVMRRAERDAEIRFCRPRRTGVQLFRLARAMGRRIVLTSDMYLDSETITTMLHRCGVEGWDAFFLSSEQDALKWNGGLYRCMLQATGAEAGKVLHIGDNWENDCVRPGRMGIHAMHMPRAVDLMLDRRRTRLSLLGLQSAASFAGEKSLQAALSFRCMQALTANRFFDNGFAPTTQESCFAGSPALLGYYAVGGHVLSVAQWLVAEARRAGVRKLVFLARDGWLIRQVVDMLLMGTDDLTTDYQPASRRCLLPALAVNPSDFYALPVNIPAYTPAKLVKLLSFCNCRKAETEMQRLAEEEGFEWNKPFEGRYRYVEFLRWYLENLYDSIAHQRAYNDLQAYYAPVLTEGAACFDMGYSGRLQAALNQLAGHEVPVWFIHDDEQECPRLERAYGFRARCFYGMKPGMSGAFREFLLSSAAPPCTGFAHMEEGVVPVYGESEYSAAAKKFLAIVQDNALRFVRDYLDAFRGTPAEEVSPWVCSMPFESALRYLGEADLAMMAGIRFEDTVFAGRDDLDLAELIRVQAAAANADCAAGWPDAAGAGQTKPLSLRKAASMLVHDRGALKEEAKRRLQGKPVLTRICRSGWRCLRFCRRLLRKEAE